MSYNFCTLFDSGYLSRGLLMYESLKKNLDDFHIYFFAFDELTFSILTRLSLPNSTIIPLSEFENTRLTEAKKTRSKVEYFWTCTSSTIEYVLDHYGTKNCTYLDADLYFYDSPKILIDEMPDGKDVLITEHRFSKMARLFEQKRAGRFCVQFVTFTKSPESRKVLKKWIDQCIEWCYGRYENGRFGDQKYLDPWPEEYDNVHVLEHKGGGIAPWNVRQYEFRHSGDEILGIMEKKEFKVVFFHFHYVRLSKETADLGWNRLGKETLRLFYKPYISKLIEMERNLTVRFPEYKVLPYMQSAGNLRNKIKLAMKRSLKFNIIDISGY